MKKETIKKIIISITIFAILLLAEYFGLSFLKNYTILFCNSNQSIDIKTELSNITGALPKEGAYSVKVITKNDNEINIYYMNDGKINNYETNIQNLSVKSYITENLIEDGISGTILYYGIMLFTAIALILLIIYSFVSKNPIKGITKVLYLILSIITIFTLLCVLPMLSKNYGGDFYYYTIILGLYIIGFVYGYKNKIFFLPTILMIPIYILANWFNYRNGLLFRLDSWCAYIFLNFIGGLTGRILEKNKGMKRKNFIFYAIITMLIIIGININKIESRTATSLISSCSKMCLLGVIYSIIAYFIYIIGKKLNENKKKEVIKNNIFIEPIIISILIIALFLTNIYFLKPHNYIESNLQNYSKKLEKQYSYKVVQGNVYVTSDYGQKWTQVPVEFKNLYPSESDFASNSYWMDENKMIFEIEEGTIVFAYSDDNGKNWNYSALTDCNGYTVYMKFFDKNNGIAVICVGTELGQREHLRVAKTTDEGKIWTTQKGDKATIRINRGANIEFTDMKNGKIENISYDGTKTIYITNDGGKTWKKE